ncbi:MAG: GNAT family N-acetyltransferase [Armatimonadaceae bacterium]
MERVWEAERIRFRRFTGADSDFLFSLDNDPEVMRYLNGGIPTSREVMEGEILPRFLHNDGLDAPFGFWAAEEKVSGVLFGWFSLRPTGTPREVSIGYRLRRSAWGKGLATEGARALLGLGFGSGDVQHIVATTYEENRASRRVLEKCGMTLVRRFRLTQKDMEGMETCHSDPGDLWDGDDLEYAIAKAEWQKKKAG